MALLEVFIGLAVASAAVAQDDSASRLEEIVVSATRRDQPVLEIPYNISALKGEDLTKLGVGDMTAIARHVPGLVATDEGVRANGLNSSFIIRGINASTVGGGAFQNLISPSVSTYIDETPMFANLRLNDVARVEVLRGPQGTLYGAGSVGGTIRIIHNAPSTEDTEFRVSAEGATLEESEDLDYGLDAVANIPVNERFALRFSAGYEELAGFIDARNSVVTDGNRVPLLADPSDPVGSPYITERIDDVDSSETWFVRGSALFDVSEDVRVLLSYHHQDEQAEGFSAQQLDAEPYTMGRPIAREPSERKLDLVAATVTADLGFATLTSATGYFEQDEESIRDISLFPTIFAQYYGYYPRITMPGYDWFSSESFTQEIRLVSSGEGPLRWTVGGYYQDLQIDTYEEELLKGIADWSELPGTGFGPFPAFGDVMEYFGLLRPSQIVPEDLTYLFDRKVKFEDKAIFGELGYDITDAWSVTVGMRAFWQENSQDLLVEIPYFGPIVAEDGNIFGRNEDFSDASFDDQIFKLNTAYQITEDTLVYATWAEGFRAGGGNAYPVGGCPYCDPPDFLSFDPDTATNYEIGVKGKVADVLQYTAAVFRIDWEDLQLETSSTSTSAIILNAGKARSQGAEIELTWVPTDELTVMAGYSYTDAELTEDVFLPIGGQLAVGDGSKGDPLPGVSDQQFSGSIDYRWPLAGSRALLFHVDASYRSEFPFRLSPQARNYRVFDEFWMVNASVGVELSENLQVLFFARNIGNEKGITAWARPEFTGNAGGPPPEFSQEFLQRPRTLGLRLAWQY